MDSYRVKVSQLAYFWDCTSSSKLLGIMIAGIMSAINTAALKFLSVFNCFLVACNDSYVF